MFVKTYFTKKNGFSIFPQWILPHDGFKHCERLVNGRFVNADLRVLALDAKGFSFGCATHSIGM